MEKEQYKNIIQRQDAILYNQRKLYEFVKSLIGNIIFFSIVLVVALIMGLKNMPVITTTITMSITFLGAIIIRIYVIEKIFEKFDDNYYNTRIDEPEVKDNNFI